MPTIRIATPNDARKLAEFAEALFRESHFGETSDADMDAYCATHFGEDLQRAEITTPGNTTFLAIDSNGGLAGYLQLRLNRQPENPLSIKGSQFAEAKRVYVAPNHFGTGLAAQLMKTCCDAAQREGADLIWLSVWQQNHRAIRFYRKQGFEIAGTGSFALGRDIQEDWIMARRLTSR